MRSTNGDRYFFALIAELFNRDKEDKFTLEDHPLEQYKHCVANNERQRVVTICRWTLNCEINYLDASGVEHTLDICDEPWIPIRVIAFLNGEAENI